LGTKAKIQMLADYFSVSMRVKYSPAATVHSQNVYLSSECPTEKHDANNDGFIDSLEAASVLGEVLIPLDDDLGSQEEGRGVFPESDALGSYTYYKETSFSKMMADLFSPDLDTEDNLRKLQVGQEFVLEGKVIVLFGVREEVYLPGSVRSIGQNSDRAFLPIACGKLTRAVPEESEMGEPEN